MGWGNLLKAKQIEELAEISWNEELADLVIKSDSNIIHTVYPYRSVRCTIC